MSAVVPAPIPTATAIAIKYIGHDFAIAASASGEILPAKICINQNIKRLEK